MKNLTNEQLCLLAKEGNANAKDALIKNNIRLVNQKAYALCKQYSGLNMEQEDLVQEGCIGLPKAIEPFDADRGYAFVTYAGQSIENAMMDFIRSLSSQFESEAAKDQFLIVSLYEPLRSENYTERIQLIADAFRKSPEQIVIEKETREEVRNAIRRLSPREQGYIAYRFGFDADDMERPLTVTAEHFHLSEGRAKQTERSALKNVRKNLPY